MTDRDIIEQMRGAVFDLLAALSYLRSINVLPKDFEIDRIEVNARKMLGITESSDESGVKVETIGALPLIHFPDKPVPAAEQPSLGDISNYRICPMCGDRGPKTVHLKRRPRGGLQCNACRFEYAFPTKWV